MVSKWWNGIPVGTKSILFGAHAFYIHPWFVAWAWIRLYGLPNHIAIWIAFIVHDLGYWNKTAMDSEEGERHVEWGAQRMANWFGPEWGDFCLLHSRYYAKKHGRAISRLCVADKLAITLEPWWFYLPRVIASGEIKEYLAYARGHVKSNHGDCANSGYAEKSVTVRGWHQAMCEYLTGWVEVHRDGRQDTWTKA